MISDFLSRILKQDPAPLQDSDARLALCALLVRIARSDNNYASVEQDRIDRIMQTRYGLDVGGAGLLREEAEALEAEAPDTVRFTRAIKEAVAYDDRIAVIESLWQIVLADGERDEAEDSILRLTASLLGISDMDSALARKRVEAQG
ncbi:MAG: tellurite resistance TerB family protein [Paracoccaceae bacterium]